MAEAHDRADLILENGVVHMLDRTGDASTNGAVAVGGGRILAVGASAGELATASTKRIDLGGRALLPAFIDSHTHFQKAALARSFSIDFLELRPDSIDTVLRHVADAVAGRPAGAWVRGDALDPRKLAEHRYPTRWELDSVAPDHAIVLLGVGNHMIAANSLALARAGIDRTTDDPPGGRLDRTGDGEPTGVLHELGKLRLDPNRPDTVLPAPSPEERLQALEAAFAHLHRSGVTTIHDVVMDPAEVAAYMDLHHAGRLGVRVRLLVRGYEAKTTLDDVIGLGLRAPFGDEWLQFSGIKLSVDGAVGERNAATFEPYPGDGDNRGLIRIEQPLLDELVERCHRTGLRVAVHAIGPRAVDMALDAYERAFEQHGRGDLRHRIEHAYLPPAPRQLDRIAAARLIVSTQPSFFWDGDGWTDIWSLDALTGVLPLRDLLDRGVCVAGGTDYPCVPIDPLPGLRAMTTRRNSEGTVLDASQAVTPAEAIALQTTAAAYAGYDEHLLGTIEVGKAADLVALSADPLADRLDDEADPIRPVLTVAGGRVVYEDLA